MPDARYNLQPRGRTDGRAVLSSRPIGSLLGHCTVMRVLFRSIPSFERYNLRRKYLLNAMHRNSRLYASPRTHRRIVCVAPPVKVSTVETRYPRLVPS